MITGKVSSTPKNAYLRCDGKGFNSSLGGFSSEGNTLSSIGGNVSNSDVVTSSTQLGLTSQDMRGSSYETLST